MYQDKHGSTGRICIKINSKENMELFIESNSLLSC